jgi:hypothetical protein
MHFELVEPVRQLFKMKCARLVCSSVCPEIVYRFPWTGLAVRILGEVTPERLSILREADTIVVSEMESPIGITASGNHLPSCCRSAVHRRIAINGPTKHDRPPYRGKSGWHDRRLGAASYEPLACISTRVSRVKASIGSVTISQNAGDRWSEHILILVFDLVAEVLAAQFNSGSTRSCVGFGVRRNNLRKRPPNLRAV